MPFTVLTILAALLIAAFLGYTMLRGRRSDEPTAAYDLRVYREQLAGVDRDLARGVIGQADAERVRTEISRRILAADAQMQGEKAQAGPSSVTSAVAVTAVALVLIGGAWFMYHRIGAAGFPDMPLSERLELAEELRVNRPSQAAAEEQTTPVQPPKLEESYAQLLQKLRDTVAQRPMTCRGISCWHSTRPTQATSRLDTKPNVG